MPSLLCLLHFLLCLLHLQQFKPQTNVTKRRRAELNPREVHVRLSRSIRGRKTKTPHSPAFAPCAQGAFDRLWLAPSQDVRLSLSRTVQAWQWRFPSSTITTLRRADLQL